MAVGKVISAVLAVSAVVGVVVIGSHQVSVRSAASDLGRRLRSVSGRRLDVPQDMAAPLKFFEDKVGPVIADWTCGQWVQIYGDTVGAQGCPNSVVLASESCDDGCKSALTSDPEFIRRRCPQTCNVAENPSDTAAADMTAPLGMFADKLPADVAAWTCDQWLMLYGAGQDTYVHLTTNGCQASEILALDQCDDGCKGAFTADPEFARRRCPASCGVSFPTKSLAGDEAAGDGGASTGDAMMGHLGDRDADMKQLAMEVQALQQQINDAASSGNMDLLSQLTTALAEKQEDLKSLAVIS